MLELGGKGWGSLRNLSKNILKQGGGWVNTKVVRRGRRVLKVSPGSPRS